MIIIKGGKVNISIEVSKKGKAADNQMLYIKNKVRNLIGEIYVTVEQGVETV